MAISCSRTGASLVDPGDDHAPKMRQTDQASEGGSPRRESRSHPRESGIRESSLADRAPTPVEAAILTEAVERSFNRWPPRIGRSSNRS